MRIERIELHKYKRLSLSGMNTLIYTPETDIQIILGTNGSGKSSLVREMMLPVSDITRDYEEDGYKILNIEHNDKKYQLSSGIPSRTKHSFLVDGDELNTGHTRKVQLKLVEEHLLLSPKISDLLLGNKSFAKMLPMERREWITELSNIDYTYPIGIYNELKRKHRDLVGGIKLYNQKINQLSENLVTDTELKKMDEDIKHLRLLIDGLTECKTVSADITRVENIDITRTVNRMLNMLGSVTDESASELNTTKVKQEVLIITNRDTLTTLRTELDGLNKDREVIVTNKETDVFREHDKVSKQLEVIRKSNYMNIDLENILAVRDGYRLIYPELITVINDMSIYQDTSIDIESFERLSKRLSDVNQSLRQGEGRITTLTATMKQLEANRDGDDIECGKCGNIWKIGYDKKLYDRTVQMLKDITESKDRDVNIQSKIMEQIDMFKSKAELIKEYNRLLTGNPVLLSVKEYIISKTDISVDNTSHLISIIDSVNLNVNSLKVCHNIIVTKAKLENTIELINKTDNIKLEYIDKKIEVLDDKYATLLKNNVRLNHDVSMIVKEIKRREELANDHHQLLKLIQGRKQMFGNELLDMRNKMLHSLILDIKHLMSEMENRVNNSKQVRHTYNEYKDTIKDIEVKELAMAQLIDKLSPSSGLIAKSINSFINVMVKDMNDIISMVWSYDIVILPCGITDDNDLDYKFKVIIDGDSERKDISELSSGTSVIVNLAFKLVFMKYKGILGYPLILDEFGMNMDNQHRINAYNMVDNILSSSFKQIFIISHFESMYGRFTNADITILDTANVTIGADMSYNKQLTLS